MSEGKHPGGRPPTYANHEQMQIAIDKYFEDCKGEILINKDTGEPYYNKVGQPVIIGEHPPTITGLALALGFVSRQSLLDYTNKSAEFSDTITRAKAFVEEYTEARLFDRDGSNGAKFSLINNFKGWREKSEVEINPDSDGVIKVSFVKSDE